MYIVIWGKKEVGGLTDDIYIYVWSVTGVTNVLDCGPKQLLNYVYI